MYSRCMYYLSINIFERRVAGGIWQNAVRFAGYFPAPHQIRGPRGSFGGPGGPGRGPVGPRGPAQGAQVRLWRALRSSIYISVIIDPSTVDIEHLTKKF